MIAHIRRNLGTLSLAVRKSSIQFLWIVDWEKLAVTKALSSP